MLTLDLRTARRLVVTRQRLAGPLPAPDLEAARSVLRSLRCVQLDPINVVARSHVMVLWSRLGTDPRPYYDELLRERWLFEFWAHAASLVLTEDHPVHAVNMANFPPVWATYGRQVQAWLAANGALRESVLAALSAGGPLPTSAFEDHAAVGWESSGWTNGRNVERMLDFLWRQGSVMVSGRRGSTRLWDLAERCLPEGLDRTPAPLPQARADAVEHSLRALGVAREADVQEYFIRGYHGDLAGTLASLLDRGRVQEVRLEGGQDSRERWFLHDSVLPDVERIRAGDWRPRTVLLSPFDNLIADRARTLRLWDFAFRNEMYTPKHKRQYGYYLLPILHGERLVGRVSSRRDAKRGVLVVDGIFIEPGVRVGPRLRKSVTTQLGELARLAGVQEVEYEPAVAQEWRAAAGAGHSTRALPALRPS